MTDPTLSDMIDLATRYQDQVVPALMDEWAPRVADAAGIRPDDRVLDIACGTGVLTRAAASRAGPGGSVTGLDRNPGMLAVASRLSPELRWQQGTAEKLPFPDESFDAVVSQFGLMFVPEPAAALREMMRVLAPDGRLAVAVWASLDDTPAYAAEVAVVERLAGSVAGGALRAPFALGDAGRLAELCVAAGIAGATVTFRQGRARFRSITDMVELEIRGWLAHMGGVALQEAQISEILQEVDVALKPFVTDSGEVVFDSPALLVTATKPPAG